MDRKKSVVPGDDERCFGLSTILGLDSPLGNI